MIQRIQSIFLLLAAGSFGSLFGFPFAKSATKAGSFFMDGIYNLHDHIGLLAFACLGILISVITIFLFKNRQTQKRLCYLGIIISVLLPLFAILLVYKEADSIGTDNINDGYGLFATLPAILFLALAVRFINKDSKIVKSMDRLR